MLSDMVPLASTLGAHSQYIAWYTASMSLTPASASHGRSPVSCAARLSILKNYEVGFDDPMASGFPQYVSKTSIRKVFPHHRLAVDEAPLPCLRSILCYNLLPSLGNFDKPTSGGPKDVIRFQCHWCGERL